MNLEQVKKIRIAVLTGKGKLLVEPLILHGINVVGLSEMRSEFSNMNPVNKWLEILYWKLIKRKASPHLALYAKDSQISYIEKKSSSDDDFVQWLKSLNVDLLVLHFCPILPKSIFEVPCLGAVNIHPALLPKYRGPNPLFWMYYALDMNVGITLHYVDSNIDTGAIISQRSRKIEIGTSALELEKNLISEFAAPMLVEAITKLETDGVLSTIPQPAESPTVYAKRNSAEEYAKLLSSPGMTIEHFWHMLNSNDQWRYAYLSKLKNYKLYNWSLDKFVKKQPQKPYFEVHEEKGRYYISHNKGVVYLKRKLCLKKLLKKIFMYK